MTPRRTGPQLMLGLAVAIAVALAHPCEARRSSGFCTQTANTLLVACNADVKDNGSVKKAICLNISDSQARSACLGERTTDQTEGRQLCREQHDWRLAACKQLGEARYDPDLSPALFDDPKSPAKPNPYFPITVGNTWEYRAGPERNTVEIVNETKLIAGINCIVARDRVFTNGDLTEDTDDWFCPAKSGAVWYFGEETKQLESFDGDNPRRPELVDIEGSFKAGRDGAKPGIIFLASPTKGDVYLEEFSLGNAEDLTEVLSTTYSFGQDPELDRLVPQQLAQLLCSGNCVVTRNISLLEPGVEERKYYALGIGTFLETALETGEVVQLVSCNFDARCQSLPTP